MPLAEVVIDYFDTLNSRSKVCVFLLVKIFFLDMPLAEVVNDYFDMLRSRSKVCSLVDSLCA